MQDDEVKALVDKYRELEQIRFLTYSVGKFNIEYLDEFLGVNDAIFELRLPNLLYILSKYGSLEGKQATSSKDLEESQ